jgi:hypothetical protein
LWRKMEMSQWTYISWWIVLVDFHGIWIWSMSTINHQYRSIYALLYFWNKYGNDRTVHRYGHSVIEDLSIMSIQSPKIIAQKHKLYVIFHLNHIKYQE